MVIEEARRLASAVLDPELPVITIADLGILRDVLLRDDGGIEVVITPTYSGCPAMDAIRDDIAAAVPGASVRTVLSPPWTTDWITEEGREKLREHGISPPGSATLRLSAPVRCPRCDSLRTREVSRFGSTACKALYTCTECLEPFDHVKEL